jgi:hypothetical protein
VLSVYVHRMGYPAGYPGDCPDCDTAREVSETYDAALCPLCDEWQSPACSHGCPACKARPNRPSQAQDLDLTPSEVHADYNLDTTDEGELLRRVVLPVVRGTLPQGAVRDIKITKHRTTSREHWPRDVELRDDVFCQVTLESGEQWEVYLTLQGDVDPEMLAVSFADRLEDDWCESTAGWGQRAHAVYKVPPPALS